MIDVIAVAYPKAPARKKELLPVIAQTVSRNPAVCVYLSETTEDVLMRIRVDDSQQFIEIIVGIFAACRPSDGDSLVEGIDIHQLGAHTPAEDFTEELMGRGHVK
jgi:hypothetical protein